MMTRASIIQIVLCLHVIYIRQAKGIYQNLPINNAIQYIQDYNGMNIGSMILIDNLSGTLEEEAFMEDFTNIAITSKINLCNIYRTMANNTNHILYKIRKLAFPSLMIMPEIGSLNFSEIKTYQLRDNIWLILLSSNFPTYEKMNEIVKNGINGDLTSSSSFTIDSQVYVLAKIQGNYILYEVYKSCSSQPLVIKQLTHIMKKMNFSLTR